MMKDTPDWARACLKDIGIFLEQETKAGNYDPKLNFGSFVPRPR